MQRGWGSGSTRTVGQGARLVALVGVAALVVLGSIAGTALAKKGSTVWLCKPALENDPCTNPLTTTVINTNGETSLEKAKKASRPPIDCFYVYPTVSEQPTMNANLEIEPQETQIAIDQASRFSQDCRVFAPMYPQLTLKAINEPGGVTLEGEAKAYFGVLDAWHEYLQRYNKGRGVVLIGHSQGSALLIQMIKEAIDPDPSMRHLLVSAVLLGGNVLVPEGKLVGGDFQNIPACQAAYQTHCVIAYSTFLKEPPEGSFFGRPNSPLLGGGHEGMQVLCVNPAQFTQNEGATGPLLPYASTTPFPGLLGLFTPTPTGSTPWVASTGEYTAQCHNQNGASWLQVNPVGTPVDPPEYVKESLGPDWGLHLYDVNIALGNLVKTVAVQAQAYEFEQ